MLLEYALFRVWMPFPIFLASIELLWVFTHFLRLFLQELFPPTISLPTHAPYFSLYLSLLIHDTDKAPQSNNTVSILDGKRARGIDIALAKLKRAYEEIR